MAGFLSVHVIFGDKKIMCGISGLYLADKKIIGKEMEESFKKAANLMAHRGPDAAGFYINKSAALGHRRLSIIDLDRRSNQPLKREDLGLVIVFNGEIYNYKELKKILAGKGHSFKTDSDTEVILLLYKEFGKEFLNYLRGMFAFCIYDQEKEEFFCARDRIGEKPLVFAQNEKGFMFASEIPVILESGFVKKEKNAAALGLYFGGNFKHIPEPYSIWENIRKLKPASYLKVKDGKIIEEDFYWKIPQGGYENISAKQVKDAVIEAVALNTVSDVPISVLLSGGTDSSIIAYILKIELNQNFTAYTFGQSEKDEEILRAREVADYLGIKLKEFYFKTEDLDILKKLILQYGEPVYLLQLIYASVLYKNIGENGTKVVLTGNGADELFYGYASHNKTLLFSYLNKFFLRRRNSDIKKSRMKNALMARNIENQYKQGDLEDDFFKNYQKLFSILESKYYIDYSNFFGLFLENSHSITMTGDISGMENSVEVRSPFLDYKLVELAAKIHPKEKVGKIWDNSGAYGKKILKEAFKGCLPEKVFYRKKMGFGFNIGEKKIFKGGADEFAMWALNNWEEIFGAK